MKRYKPLFENITIPLKPGDEFLYGKWKNKKGVVAKFSKNEKGEDIIITDTGKEVPLLKIRLIKESTRILKNYKHGTSLKFAKDIEKNGFKLPDRNAIYFAPENSPLSSVYGSDIEFIVDLKYSNPIEMKDIRSKILPEMQKQKKKISEPLINKELANLGYDIILNDKKEVAVLNPEIITIKLIKKINER